MEGEGCLATLFDHVSDDDLFGAKTWEIAESEMVKVTLRNLFKKSKDPKPGFLLGGDLLNQCTASSFGALPFQIPYLGLYGACSTFAEGLLIGAAMLESKTVPCGAVFASSHFSSAERQYRYPLEYGCQRTPTSQRTVTGCGAVLLQANSKARSPACLIKGGRIGKIVDGGVTDANNMGAVMAPAAADTLVSFLEEHGENAQNYDLILTGDLGSIGAELFRELCAQKGVFLGEEYIDCGTQIFSQEQDTHAGASGCGCSAIYFAAKLFKQWQSGMYSRVLFLGTGALLSPLTVQQKLTIPGICHLVALEKEL